MHRKLPERVTDGLNFMSGAVVPPPTLGKLQKSSLLPLSLGPNADFPELIL